MCVGGGLNQWINHLFANVLPLRIYTFTKIIQQSGFWDMLRLFILHLLIKDSLVVAPNVNLCKAIDKVMSRNLEWIARDRPIDMGAEG